MADPKHLAKLEEGVDAWNSWRRGTWHEVIRRGADLQEVDLSGARLTGADLFYADLANVNLTGASLDGANLQVADLTRAKLDWADLRKANLAETNLTMASVRNADLSEATFGCTIFGDTDLTGAKGLDSCHLAMQCVLDHRTLINSGQLPLSFLRGCGLPDQFIEYLPSLLNQAIQFYSCFISYSTRDQQFADQLYADLQNNGVRCWFAPHMIQGGKKLHQQIDDAIRVYDKLLLILSEASMGSEWVKTEIAKARKRELRERRRMLFPLRLVGFETLRDWDCFDPDSGTDSAREIREYFVPDFSQWKDFEAYQQTFQRLLLDLRVEALPE